MKRLFAIVLALVLLLSIPVLPVRTQAAEILESGMCGENVTWTVFDDGRLVLSGTGATEDSDRHSVKNWYRHSEVVKHIIIEEGITYIGEWLFHGSDFYSLESVTIPTTVTKIGEHAFNEFYGYLKAVYISDLTKWCSINFAGSLANPLECEADLYLNGVRVENLVIPEDVSYIPDYAFKGCTSIRNVAITQNVISVGSFAFNSCYNLGKMVFCGNAPAFGTAAFLLSTINAYYPANNETWASQAGQSLSGIAAWLPYNPGWDDIWSDAFPGAQVRGTAAWRMDEETGTLTIYGTGPMRDYAGSNHYIAPWKAFKNITTKIVVEEGVTGIGDYAFSEYSELISVSLPSTLISIGESAFSRCDDLTHLVIPPKVDYIGRSAFKTWGLEKVVFLGSVPSQGSFRCLDNCYATVYYPADNISWTEGAKAQYADTVTWVAEVHDYTQLTSEATCTQSGMVTYACSSCGHSYSEYVVAPGHRYENGFCTVCGLEEPPFADVIHGMYYYEPVKWAVEQGITTGMTPTTFVPDGSCTRAQVVTFLWRAMGCPEPISSDNPFTDVSAGEWYSDAVLWAVEKGITLGTSESTFDPELACTRGQIVTFLWRYQGQPAAESSADPFSDLAEDAYYYDAVLWAVEEGITNGFPDGTFGPEQICTRGQIVTFLYRALNESI